MWDQISLVLDHCLSFIFTKNRQGCLNQAFVSNAAG